jgi:hypothetical protein
VLLSSYRLGQGSQRQPALPLLGLPADVDRVARAPAGLHAHPFERAVLCLNLLTEGSSIRSAERITGTRRDTICRLLVFAGGKCEKLLASTIQGAKEADDRLRAVLALHFAAYNFTRLHRSIRMTPAMKAGVTRKPWSLGAGGGVDEQFLALNNWTSQLAMETLRDGPIQRTQSALAYLLRNAGPFTQLSGPRIASYEEH